MIHRYHAAALVAFVFVQVTLAACVAPGTGNLFGDSSSGGPGGGSAGDGGSEAAGDAPLDGHPLQPGDPCDDGGGHYDKGGMCCHTCLDEGNGCGPCAGSCPGNVCAGGAPDLACACPSNDPACACALVVCGVQPACCGDGGVWDVTCVAAVMQLCAAVACTNDACAHSPCVVGGPLVGGHDDACSLRVYRVCSPGYGNMPECCATAWTVACVTEAVKLGEGC